jgi:hypothetical protein
MTLILLNKNLLQKSIEPAIVQRQFAGVYLD